MVRKRNTFKLNDKKIEFPYIRYQSPTRLIIVAASGANSRLRRSLAPTVLLRAFGARCLQRCFAPSTLGNACGAASSFRLSLRVTFISLNFTHHRSEIKWFRGRWIEINSVLRVQEIDFENYLVNIFESLVF